MMPAGYMVDDKELEAIQRVLSSRQSGGHSEAQAIDREWLLEPGRMQEFMLYYFPESFWEWEPINDIFFDFLENTPKGVALVPAQHGKDLDCETPILTTCGWKTMGTLHVGDEVYGVDGKPTRISFVSEVFYNHCCYELMFTDGARLVAGEGHLWRIKDDADHGKWKTLTTREIAESSWCRRAPRARYRYKVRCDGVLETPVADLPVDPYIFGYWLGDGTSVSASLTVGAEDQSHVVESLVGPGYRIVSQRLEPSGAWKITFNIGADMRDGFMARAKRLGVLGNKHIPDLYLTASREQRLALLAGLMDSDGSIHQAPTWCSPRMEFCSCSERLAKSVHELLRSLGVRVALVESDAVIYGRIVGRRYRLSWTGTFNPFWLPRKADRFQQPFSDREKSLLSIVGVRQIETRPTCCIQVEHEESLFLAGRHFIPTHNTTMLHRWFIRVMCEEPNISIGYTEKNEPTAYRRSYALMQQLERNQRLIRHYGRFKPTDQSMWSMGAFTIKQRTVLGDSPTFSAYGAGGGSVLGWRVNILVNDDPVTQENSESALERGKLLRWFSAAARTCPVPLPIKVERYLVKHELVGTPFRMDDLYATVTAGREYELLHMQAVLDESEGTTLSPRYIYQDPQVLAERARTSELYAQVLEAVRTGRKTNLWTFRYSTEGGTVAFFQRYQCTPFDPDSQEWQMVHFRGDGDEYPGCFDEELSYGQLKSGWIAVTALDPQSGSTTKASARVGLITLAANPAEPNKWYAVDLDYGKWKQMSADPAARTQMSRLVDHLVAYDSLGIIESNAAQKGLIDAARLEAQKRGTTIRVKPHHTGRNKYDPEVGLRSLLPMFERGAIRLPYQTPADQKKSDELAREFTMWGVYPYNDLAMAFWMAAFWLRLRLKVRRKAMVHQELPDYVNRISDIPRPRTWSDAQWQAFRDERGLESEELEKELMEAMG